MNTKELVEQLIQCLLNENDKGAKAFTALIIDQVEKEFTVNGDVEIPEDIFMLFNTPELRTAVLGGFLSAIIKLV